MSNIGLVIRERSYLKILQPIILELNKLGYEYNIYHYDIPRGEKEYDRASIKNISLSSPEILKNAKKVQAFQDDKQLLKYLINDKIKKLVSLEIWLWTKTYISKLRSNGIKLFSILYLNDSLWQPKDNIEKIDRVYYTTRHYINLYYKFSGAHFDNNRDRFLGSPIFDCINSDGLGDNILVLLPNLREEHVKKVFGDKSRFIKIIQNLSLSGNLIFKYRKKQWFPEEIKKYAKYFVDDGHIMYPNKVSELLKETHIVVMFYSTGIFECVYGNNYVVNIPTALNRWAWDMAKMKEFHNSEIYNYYGVVESIDQDVVLSPNWRLENKSNKARRDEWINKYIGKSENSAFKIAKDIAEFVI